MSSETRTSIRASERRRQRVVVAGVAGVAVLTAGAIAYWPGGSSHGGASAASSLVLPGSAAGAPTDQAWDPTSASTRPGSGVRLADGPDAGTSRGMTRTPLAPSAAPSSAPAGAPGSAPAGAPNGAPGATQRATSSQSSSQAQSGTPVPAAGSAVTAVPALPSTSVPRPIIGHGTAEAPQAATPTVTSSTPSTSTSSRPTTSSSTATSSSTTTSTAPLVPSVSVSVGATVAPTPTPTATQRRNGCVLFVLC